MKITHVKTRVLATPAITTWLSICSRTARSAMRRCRIDGHARVRHGRDDDGRGIDGVGITFFGAALTKALREAVDALGSW